MQGVEKAHLNASLRAIVKAFYDLYHSTVGDALQPVNLYGKTDTLGMDSGPEITIGHELNKYDSGAVVITEEVGRKEKYNFDDTFRPNDPSTFRTVFICDPTDRSNQLKSFLRNFPKDAKVGDILTDSKTPEQWEKDFGSPASITGATSAISCIRRGVPIFSVIVNYITQEVSISCAAGNRILKLTSEKVQDMTLEYICKFGDPIIFPAIEGQMESMRKFVTFLGDEGKVGYKENLLGSGFMTDPQLNEFLHYPKPGGPSRALYLSTLQTQHKTLGFVLSNGEKIGEWIHWLPFLRFAKSQEDDSQPALILYEIFQDRPFTKEGILMAPPPTYSIFREYGDKIFVDTSWLLRMPNPSRLRGTIILAPYDNRWVVSSSDQSGYRQIIF